MMPRFFDSTQRLANATYSLLVCVRTFHSTKEVGHLLLPMKRLVTNSDIAKCADNSKEDRNILFVLTRSLSPTPWFQK